MPTCAEVLARTLREAGITRMFGLPGGEILDFIDAARREGIEFLLTRQEATASFMADVTGQIQRRPGVCVATLGPGAVNMTLGVANAYLERSPVIAITATLAKNAARYATHQDLDLNAVYRPFTKLAITLDGYDTAAKVRHAIAVSMAPRMGPVHIALPSDIAKSEDVPEPAEGLPQAPSHKPQAASVDLSAIVELLERARRPIAILGIDLNPLVDAPAVREFIEAFQMPVFTTPKAKGIFPEDHPLFYGVCAGVSGDAVVLEYMSRSDLLVGIGFDPVESDKLWHQSMPLVSIGPVSIAAAEFTPRAEVVGDVPTMLAMLGSSAVPAGRGRRSFPAVERRDARDLTPTRDRIEFRAALEDRLRPSTPPRGLSGFELTRRLRALFPRDTILVTDVGSVKMVTTQAWSSYAPLTFFESNGLSAMSYSLAGAMAARLQFPDRPILCTIGDGGFGMTIADIETCVRERLYFVTVVFNDSSLSLIDVAQERRGYPTAGVRHGAVDFSVAAAGFGAWTRRVETLDELDAAVRQAPVDRPVVIDAVVDPSEYRAHTRAFKPAG